MTLRAVWRLALIVPLLLLCLSGFALSRLFGDGSFWVSLFLRRLGHILGLRVRTEGQPVPSHALYVANHISWLDILALAGAGRNRFIAKAEIAHWGLVGWLARLARTVFVSRERRSETRAQADTVATALGQTRPVVLFAEGGTGDGRTLTPFRPSLFVSAIEAGAMVQPVAIDYGPDRADYAWPDGTRFLTEGKRILNRGGQIPLTLRFLVPLDARAMDRKQLASRAHQAIGAALT